MDKTILIFGAIGLALGVLVIALGLNTTYNHPNKLIGSKDLKEGASYQICTASVITQNIICREKNIFMQTYNKTLKEIDSFMADCPDWIIIKGRYCVGDRIDITGGRNI